jgi:uncharacterized protein (TIGR03086 family)
MSTRHGSAVVTLPSDTTILITRVFEAPAVLVWDLITMPRHVLRWWGPIWSPLVSCEIDLRVGGSWRYVSEMDGQELGWHGVYREIEPPHRIVSTEVFEGFPDAASVNTMTLTEVDCVTTLQTLVQHTSREHRDGHIDSGMEGGMQETFNRLDDLITVAGSTAERFRRAAGGFSDLAGNVDVNRWDSPAPCEGWVARDIVRHMVEWMPSVLGRSGLSLTEGPPVEADPERAWQHLADQLQAMLDDPAAAATEFDVGPPGRMTVENAIGMIMLGDIVIHTWDLAVSTGQDVRLDATITAEMLEGMQPMDEMLRNSGHYGPKVPVAAGASVQDRLIAFTGRDPNWSNGEFLW